jgi:hypothetical protein
MFDQAKEQLDQIMVQIKNEVNQYLDDLFVRQAIMIASQYHKKTNLNDNMSVMQIIKEKLNYEL